jgi:hypothetical protein
MVDTCVDSVDRSPLKRVGLARTTEYVSLANWAAGWATTLLPRGCKGFRFRAPARSGRPHLRPGRGELGADFCSLGDISATAGRK